MVRIVKREPVNTRSSGGVAASTSNGHNDGSVEVEAAGRLRLKLPEETTILKREKVSTRIRQNRGAESNGEVSTDEGTVGIRRVLRSHYLSVKSRISDERDDISKVDSDKFKSIIEEVERLHQRVQKPREQVADAEALLDITNTLVTSVKAHGNEGVTPSDFVSCLLRDFGQEGGSSSITGEDRDSICWKYIGCVVSHVFRSAPCCCTMIGPMNTEVKQRKTVVHRKRMRPTERERPEELEETVDEEKTDTDKNMATMFQILRKHKTVRLENLILNRKCFAQTVENLFALSFLIKDGRADITIDEKGCHLVSPRNGPAANAVLSGEVSYSHFVFRFDFQDWKLMLGSVNAGEELMPLRTEAAIPTASTSEATERPVPTTPIRKLTRNRGLVFQEQTVVEESPESDNCQGAAADRKGKRKLT
nr:PREDICTED: non-structural maintenance of chromosomes element 4 homolog A-like isoform X1 [Nicotiana tabacum]